MLTVADLQGSGGDPAVPVLVRTVSPEEQEQQMTEARAAQAKAASELPESASTKAMLDLLGNTKERADAYRVGITNAMELAAALKSQMLTIRQGMLSARLTEADRTMRTKLQAMIPSVNGVLLQFTEVHTRLQMIEDGLSQIERASEDVLAWAKETGYIQSDAT
jgi:hypothetical protein